MTSRWMRLCAMAMLLVGTGCAAGDDLDGEPRRAALAQAAPEVSAPPPVHVVPPEPNLPLVGQPVPVPFERTIDWEAAAEGPQLPVGSLSEVQRQAAARAPVPPLLPHKPDLLEVATLLEGEHWFAASMVRDGHDVYVHGTRIAYKVPGHRVHQAGRKALEQGFIVTRNEGYAILSFKAHGAAYMLQVGCARPETDSRCTEDDYILELANSLAMAQGGTL